jgi:DNA polymerase (family X)
MDGAGEIRCATEEEVYEVLGLPWIPPELREDRGEIQAAKGETAGVDRTGRHPRRPAGALHLERRETEHAGDGESRSRARQKGGRLHRPFRQPGRDRRPEHGTPRRAAGEIEATQKELGDSIRILHASEVEIKADGSLDYPDEFLASLDLVVASMHTGLRQPREKVTERTLNAIRNPHVDIIGHPTGRLIPEREGADLDMDAVLAAAAESGVALEINAHPARLDLEDIYARRAKEMGIPISINTDAHSEADLDMLFYGVATARRAWLTAEDVINTWPTEKLLAWLQKRGK